MNYQEALDELKNRTECDHVGCVSEDCNNCKYEKIRLEAVEKLQSLITTIKKYSPTDDCTELTDTNFLYKSIASFIEDRNFTVQKNTDFDKGIQRTFYEVYDNSYKICNLSDENGELTERTLKEAYFCIYCYTQNKYLYTQEAFENWLNNRAE